MIETFNEITWNCISDLFGDCGENLQQDATDFDHVLVQALIFKLRG